MEALLSLPPRGLFLCLPRGRLFSRAFRDVAEALTSPWLLSTARPTGVLSVCGNVLLLNDTWAGEKCSSGGGYE